MAGGRRTGDNPTAAMGAHRGRFLEGRSFPNQPQRASCSVGDARYIHALSSPMPFMPTRGHASDAVAREAPQRARSPLHRRAFRPRARFSLRPGPSHGRVPASSAGSSASAATACRDTHWLR